MLKVLVIGGGGKLGQMLSRAATMGVRSGQGEALDKAKMTLPCPLPVLHKPLVLSQISDFIMNVRGEAAVSQRSTVAAAGAEG